MTQKTLSLCVLTALILMTGCTSNKGPQPMVYSPPSAKEAPRSFTTMMEDSLILTRIKTKLFSDDLVDGKGIDILVRHGVVYLTGQAMDDAHRRMAMDIIRTVEGVVRIENQLTIGNQGTTFETAHTMVQKKIKIEMLQDAELNSLPVVINASETQILLSGNVHSQAQKQKAGAIAQKNAGDRQVINQIKVVN